MKTRTVKWLIEQERKTLTYACDGFAILLGAFTLVFLCINYYGTFLGLGRLNTPNAMERYQHLNVGSPALLPYDQAVPIGESIVVTFSRNSEYFIGNMPLPIQGEVEKSDVQYTPYLLLQGDTRILYLAAHQPVNIAAVYAGNRLYSLQSALLARYADYRCTYVFVEETPMSLLTLGCMALAVMLLLLLGMAAHRICLFPKCSKLGRQINSMGGFQQVADQVDVQLEHPLFSNASFLLLEDYLLVGNLIRSSERYELFPLQQIRCITLISPEPDDADDDGWIIAHGATEKPLYFAKMEQETLIQILQSKEISIVIGAGGAARDL